LKFDETPNYVNLSNLLADLDCGFRFYLAECKKSFMKASSKLILKESVAKNVALQVKRKVDRSIALIIKLMAKKTFRSVQID
jgi:hypothetical protein